jgi:hypothetical protein
MRCGEFRDKHVAFVDDLLPAFEMDAMRRHLMVCSGCSRQDTKVRRSLMLVRSLPPVEVSPEFMTRLNARLASMEPVSRTDVVSGRPALPTMLSWAAVAAGVAAGAYLAMETNNYFVQPGDLPAANAVAMATSAFSTPESPAQITNAALVAAVPTGIPVWPAVLMVGQTPMRFASLEQETELPAR